MDTKGNFYFAAFTILTCCFFGVVIVGSIACNMSVEQVTITVTDKDRATSENGTSHRIYSERETFIVKDSIYYWTFNSADRYRELKRGKTYACKAVGWRIPALSMFRNLISCQSR